MNNNEYDVSNYTDEELYSILDLQTSSPTDSELEGAIIQKIQRHMYLRTSSGRKLFQFFRDIYEHFFNLAEETEDTTDDFTHDLSTLEKHNYDPAQIAKAQEERERQEAKNANPVTTNAAFQTNNSANPATLAAGTFQTENVETPNALSGSPIQATQEVEYASGKVNPILKETYTRIVTINSQYRDPEYVLSTDFTVNFSETLKDVVKMKLYAVQLPITWYTISESYGSNFFYLKPVYNDGSESREDNTWGIYNNENHYYKVEIDPGNYTNDNLVAAVNSAIGALHDTYTDVSFGSSGATYGSTSSKTTMTIDILKTYTGFDYDISMSSELREALQWNEVITSPNQLYYRPDSLSENWSVSSSSSIANNNIITVVQYDTDTPTTIFSSTTIALPTDVTYTASEWASTITNLLATNNDLSGSTLTFSQIPSAFEAIANPIESDVSLSSIKIELVYPYAVSELSGTIQVYNLSTNVPIEPSLSIVSSEIGNNPFITNDGSLLFTHSEDSLTTIVAKYTVNDNWAQTQSISGIWEAIDGTGTVVVTKTGTEFQAYVYDETNPLTSIGDPIQGERATISSDGLYLAIEDAAANIQVYEADGTDNIWNVRGAAVSGTLPFVTENGDVLACIENGDVKIYDFSMNSANYELHETLSISGEKVEVANDGLRFVAIDNQTISLYSRQEQSPSSGWTYLIGISGDDFSISHDGTKLLVSNIDNPSAKATSTLYQFNDTFRGYFMWDIIPNRNTMSIVPYSQWRIERPNDPIYSNLLPGTSTTLGIHSQSSLSSAVSFSEDQHITFVPRYNAKGGVYIANETYARYNDIRVDISQNVTTTAEVIEIINAQWLSSGTTEKSTASITNEDVADSTVDVSIQIQLAKMYTTKHYKLVFYDISSFTKCTNTSNSYRNATVDSTLGYILGFKSLMEYELLESNLNIPTGLVKGYFMNPDTGVSTGSVYIYTPSSSSGRIVAELTGNSVVSVYLYNYFMIILDDFNQNHLNDGLVTLTQRDNNVSLPKYANRKKSVTCDPVTGEEVITGGETSQTNLTQKQLYSIEQLIETQNTQKSYYNRNASVRDMFALLPVKASGQPGSIYVEFGGTLQQQERIYFGPVNIRRIAIKLINDKGDTVDLNGGDWSFQLVVEQLYQKK
jgi:hypothetical protein